MPTKEIVGAFAYMENPIDTSRILMILRKKPPYAGYFSIPGGALNDGESREQAVVRETREEIGVDIELGRYLGKVSFPGDFNPDYHFTGHVFQSYFKDVKDTDMMRPQRDEVERIMWLGKSELADRNVAPPVMGFYGGMRRALQGELVDVDLIGARTK